MTGAAGFIASHVIIDLLEDGHVVHATVRDLGDDTKRAHLDVLEERYPGKLQCFEADLLEPGSLDAALEGCDALIHTATAVILAAPDPQKQIIDVAVKGTQNVLDSVARTLRPAGQDVYRRRLVHERRHRAGSLRHGQDAVGALVVAVR
jgi:nucleoside-diphosphate-sugar epimerase